MVKQAEKMKETDKKKKEIIELKNEAESIVYNTDKQLKENESKIGQDLQDRIRADINAVNDASNSENLENLKECIERLRNSAMEMGKAIYSQANNNTNSNTEQSTENNKPNEEEEKKN